MIYSGVLSLTPDLAAEFLRANLANRKVSRSTVATYAQAITRGEWQLNGEPIIVSDSGQLLNGQHRCHAVISAKRPIDVLIVRGISGDAFKTLDTGKKRSASDALGIDGLKNTRLLATAARAILRLEGGSVKFSGSYTNTQIADCIARHPNVPIWATRLTSSPAKRFLPGAMVGVLTLAEKRHGLGLCLNFFEKVSGGLGLSADDPAHLLRERFISRTNGVNLNSDYVLAICVKAMNAAVLGKRMSLLRWGGSEEMPELI